MLQSTQKAKISNLAMATGFAGLAASPGVVAHSEVSGQSGLLLAAAHEWIHATQAAPVVVLAILGLVSAVIFYGIKRKRRVESSRQGNR